MYTKLIAVLIALVLVFGSAAATASAAQESLPTDALYSVKTLGESVALGLSVSPAEKLEKALEHTQRRVSEMAGLTKMGVNVPEQVSKDYGERVEYALRLAARMPDDQMTKALEKIQQSLRQELTAVEQLRASHPEDAQLARVETQLHQHMDLVALGLSNPGVFREQLASMLKGSEGPSSTKDPSATEEPSGTETPEPEDENSNDTNVNDSNTNEDEVNGNEDNANDDDGNINDDDNNTNDDDSNINDDANNTNDDNANINDDGNTNDHDSNGNDDNSRNTNDDSSNGNDENGGSGNGGGNGNEDNHGRGGGGSGATLNTFFFTVAQMAGLPVSD
jgi:Domain of unknown function (DUF5667)